MCTNLGECVRTLQEPILISFILLGCFCIKGNRQQRQRLSVSGWWQAGVESHSWWTRGTLGSITVHRRIQFESVFVKAQWLIVTFHFVQCIFLEHVRTLNFDTLTYSSFGPCSRVPPCLASPSFVLSIFMFLKSGKEWFRFLGKQAWAGG